MATTDGAEAFTIAPESLAGRTAFVTGAASGIGQVIARLLREEGARLILVDRNPDGLAPWAGDPAVKTMVVDLADREAVVRCAAEAIALGWGIDCLVNAAGITGAGRDILNTTLEDWELVHAVDSTAPFLLMREIGRHMVERGQGGRIVNVTSSSAHRAAGVMPAYGAAKSSLMQLTRVAAAQLGPHGINVNAVAPGLTRTPMLAQTIDDEQLAKAMVSGPMSNLLQRPSEPEDIAAVVLFLCQPASRQITAQTIHVSAGAIIQA